MTTDLLEEILLNADLSDFLQAFHDADVTAEMLPTLDAADLKELGLTIGQRKRLQKAIGILNATSEQPHTSKSPAHAKQHRMAGRSLYEQQICRKNTLGAGGTKRP